MTSICIAHGGDISLPSGGTNRVIAFAKALRDNGFDVHLVVPKPKNNLQDLDDIKVHEVAIRRGGVKDQAFRALLVSLKAKSLARKENATLQIEHSTLGGFATLIGCSNFILDMHDLAFESPLYGNLPFSRLIQKFIYKIEKRAVSKASKIIAVSNSMKDFIMREWNVSEEKVEVIPNGYWEEKFKKFDFNEIHEVDGMICFLGTLHLKLDLDKIIRLAKSLENSQIYIIGDGPMRAELERKINESRVSNIIFVGWLPEEEALKFVVKSQVCIMPLTPSLSTKVSCPVKLFSYAALGKAIVTDDIADMCRVFKEHNAVLVCDPANPYEFIENVKKLLENKLLRKKVSSNARRLVNNYTWENMGRRIVSLYEKIISEN